MSDHFFQSRVLHLLNAILDRLGMIEAKETLMANELQTLQTQVAANTDAEQSAIVLLQGLKTALDQAIASGNPAALTALSAALGTSQQALAAAITANTPAAP